MENETNLVHHKLETQEWGKPGVMLWSEAQRACIEEGRKSFQEKKASLPDRERMSRKRENAGTNPIGERICPLRGKGFGCYQNQF